MESSQAVLKLTAELQKLPGIGKKTAQRLVYFLLKSGKEQPLALSNALTELSQKVILCSVCGGITEQNPCTLCSSDSRNKSIVCVVEQPLDIALFERVSRYNGLYHVLMGTLAPLDGVGPEALRIDQLVERVSAGEIKEVILATNPTTDGEATAIYIAKLLKEKDVKTTRIARGVPVGSDLEFVDEITLMKSLESRQSI